MASALSFLPQTGQSEDGSAATSTSEDNTPMTNQQKLVLFDAIVNEEDDRL